MKKFCNALLELSYIVKFKYPRDGDIVLLHDKLDIACSSIPAKVIQITGPYIYQYKTEIQNEDVEAFFKIEPPVEEYQEFSVKKLFSMCKEAYKSADDDEKAKIKKLIKKLLVYYSEYLLETMK